MINSMICADNKELTSTQNLPTVWVRLAPTTYSCPSELVQMLCAYMIRNWVQAFCLPCERSGEDKIDSNTMTATTSDKLLESTPQFTEKNTHCEQAYACKSTKCSKIIDSYCWVDAAKTSKSRGLGCLGWTVLLPGCKDHLQWMFNIDSGQWWISSTYQFLWLENETNQKTDFVVNQYHGKKQEKTRTQIYKRIGECSFVCWVAVCPIFV